MGGLMRLRPVTIVQHRRQAYTCTTKGCPEPAVIILPLNHNVLHEYEATGVNHAQWWATEQSLVNEVGLEMRLCRKCVRTLATALPEGMRLAGALLRYPEIAPNILAAEEIPGTLEYRDKYMRERVRQAIVSALHDEKN